MEILAIIIIFVGVYWILALLCYNTGKDLTTLKGKVKEIEESVVYMQGKEVEKSEAWIKSVWLEVKHPISRKPLLRWRYDIEWFDNDSSIEINPKLELLFVTKTIKLPQSLKVKHHKPRKPGSGRSKGSKNKK